ncbi:ornithine--oxo-acid transaminase [Bacillus sp. FJAT-45350]|uniref:ornithine--oxo-acid transaminase n=1 Tax=Bacillus sp. FJAT-45350 TaxID=2011014 RepID=UPI000BB85F24|nr:ornithine--oxo-acid transaminase [Bacillus sp. FJAT-45350]
MNQSKNIIQQTEQYGAKNYLPLPIVISEAEGVWVRDPEGNRYLDMLSAYSALNQGHRHPRIIDALKKQADKITLTSRAFYNDQLGSFYHKVVELTGKTKVLPMNTGAEAVETAIKAARRWGYRNKGITKDKAEIIVCENNFHGRTLAAVSLSSNDEYKEDFGPMLPGIKVIPYGDSKALEEAITENTAAFLVEPIQGEAGIVIPPDGYLKEVREICSRKNVLFIADEIQSGLGRSGQWFACDWEQVTPDMYILGKALGGGVMPISSVVANHEILSVFNPGSHGSTFGGNPLACATAIAALKVIEDEKLVTNSRQLGDYLIKKLQGLQSDIVKEVRGRGLFIGIELTQPARKYCEKLKQLGILCKETHENVIRLAPPLVIKKEEIDWAFQKIKQVL